MFKKSPLRKYWFVLFFAPPGQGKSLEQADLTLRTFKEYKKTEKKYPELPNRILYSNQRLNFYNFPDWCDKDFISGHFRYWYSPEDFRYCDRKNCWKDHSDRDKKVTADTQNRYFDNHDIDLFVDEAGNLFPSDEWSSTPKWLREMWSQHRHHGIRMVMLTQDYMMVDINARRMLWKAYYIKKHMGSRDISPTLPPLTKWSFLNIFNPKKSTIWGVYSLQEFDPLVLKLDTLALITLETIEEKKEIYEEVGLTGKKYPRFITFKKISLYDTTEKVNVFNRK